MSKNVLITGGAGFIGSNLAIELLKQGFNITVLDSLSKQIHGDDYNDSYLYNTIKDKVTFIKGDVRNKDDWNKALLNQDVVVHLAAETGTGQSMYNIENYIDVNVRGTALLLDILTNNSHSVKKVIIASSRAIYGEGKYYCKTHDFVYPKERRDSDMSIGDFEVKCPFCNENLELVATDEDSKILPTSIYGITKQTQEEMVLVSCKSIGIKSIAYRFQNVYGPGQSLKNPYTGIISIFSTLIKNKKTINIFEDGKESRDFVYIKDVVDAIILGINDTKIISDVFNVGSGESTTVIDVANKLIENYNEDTQITISGNYRIGDIRHSYASLKKIESILGFKPKFSFSKGINLFTTWVDSQKIEKDGYEDSIKEMKKKGLYK